MSECHKYAEWITDEALGMLAAGREAELLAHAAECEDCRTAYRDARELAMLVDRGVESLVGGEPSPHFATRLRAQIAEQGEHARVAGLTWKPVAAGLVLAMVAAIALVSHGPSRHRMQPAPPIPQTQVRQNATRTMAVSPEANAALRAKPATEDFQVRRGLRGSAHAQAVIAQARSRRNVMRDSAAPPQPEVIVPPGQLAAVMQFAEAINSGRIDGKQILTAQQEMDKPLEIQPLEIKPIEIAPQVPPSDISSQTRADSTRP